MTTETSKERCGPLTMTDFSYSQPCFFFLVATVFQFDGGEVGGSGERNTHTNTHTQSRLLNVYYYFIRSLTVRTCI